MNKVIGNIHLSPGRSFQTAQSRIYELVPYLKNDGNRHDFSHTVHHMYFTADDEADEFKAQVSREMRERLGIYQNPLDGNTARVRSIFVCVYVCPSVAEAERERRFCRRRKRSTCSTTSSRSYRRNSALWTVTSSTRTNIASHTLSATSRPARRVTRTKVYRYNTVSMVCQVSALFTVLGIVQVDSSCATTATCRRVL